MASEEYEKRPYQFSGLLWIARILGTIMAAILFYLAFSEFLEEIRGNSPAPLETLINGQYFMVITMTLIFVGLVLAYWKEGLGGGIALISFLVFFIVWADFHVGFILAMSLFTLPSILYVVYWWLVYRYHRSQRTED